MLVTVGLVLLIITVCTVAAARLAVANRAAVAFVTCWALSTLLVLVPRGIELASMSEHSHGAQLRTLAVVGSGLVLGVLMLRASYRLARGQHTDRSVAWHALLRHVAVLVVLVPSSWPLLDADLRVAGSSALAVPAVVGLAFSYVLWPSQLRQARPCLTSVGGSFAACELALERLERSQVALIRSRVVATAHQRVRTEEQERILHATQPLRRSTQDRTA